MVKVDNSPLFCDFYLLKLLYYGILERMNLKEIISLEGEFLR